MKTVLVDSSTMDVAKLKSNNSLLMHSLYTVADIGNGSEVIKLYVEEMNNPNASTTMKRGYQLQNIKKYRPTGKGSQNASPISPVSGTQINIADLFDCVKGLDKNFDPSDTSKITNADGTPKIMYHGTQDGGFHTFVSSRSDYISLFFVGSNEAAMSYI